MHNDTVRTQAAITKHLKHRNLVTLYEVIDDPSHHTLYLILGLLAGSPAQKRKGHALRTDLGRGQSESYQDDVLRGLEYLHSVNVVHRDVACGVHGAFTMTTPCKPETTSRRTFGCRAVGKACTYG